MKNQLSDTESSVRHSDSIPKFTLHSFGFLSLNPLATSSSPENRNEKLRVKYILARPTEKIRDTMAERISCIGVCVSQVVASRTRLLLHLSTTRNHPSLALLLLLFLSSTDPRTPDMSIQCAGCSSNNYILQCRRVNNTQTNRQTLVRLLCVRQSIVVRSPVVNYSRKKWRSRWSNRFDGCRYFSGEFIIVCYYYCNITLNCMKCIPFLSLYRSISLVEVHTGLSCIVLWIDLHFVGVVVNIMIVSFFD